MKYYLCFDIGGSSMKSGLLSREGKIIEKKSYLMPYGHFLSYKAFFGEM